MMGAGTSILDYCFKVKMLKVMAKPEEAEIAIMIPSSLKLMLLVFMKGWILMIY